jgi:hypothetical protein
VTPLHPARIHFTRSTSDGVISFVRQGSQVTLHLSYRDPIQSCPDPLPARDALTRAVDGLRDQAVTAMRGIVAGLLDGLLPQLSPAGQAGEFVEPAFRHDIVIPWIEWRAKRLSVRLPTFYCTVTDSDGSGASDRWLAEEYGRAVVRERVAELWRLYEEVRRDLLEDAEQSS